MGREHVRRRPRSVRARTTIVAISTVSVALVIGALALITILRISLRNSVDRAATSRAQDVASLIRSGALPARLAFPGQESTIIQVVDARGVVIATSANFDGVPPVSNRPGADPPTLFNLRAAPVKDNQRFRVAALSVPTTDGDITIYAGESTDQAEDTVARIGLLLLVGTPVLILIVGVVTWRNARRALEPVHRIIAEVDAMTEGVPHARIAPPGTDDEIGELATTMNAMLDRLDRFTARQRRFTGDASHELRSPLASLRTQLEVAVAHPAGVDVADIGAELLADVERLERLASGLLELARLDHAAVQHAPIDIRDVIDDVLASTASTRLIRCQSEIPSEPVIVSGDRRQLERVLRNLLDNAERYARSNIELRLDIAGDRCTLEVINDGPSILVADRQRIFERFTRLDDSRAQDHGGAGLGLAIVNEIVQAHHGTIQVLDPRTGSGARFVVELPRVHTSDEVVSRA
jgi:signal transduction histidine kinase